MVANPSPQQMHVRVGCSLAYETSVPTFALFQLRPERQSSLVLEESLSFGIAEAAGEYEDRNGNLVSRAMLQPGRNEVRHDALVVVPAEPDSQTCTGPLLPLQSLPSDVLHYILPSRCCDADRLLDLAWEHFGAVPDGLERVLAICDWVHTTLEYRFGSGLPGQTASEVIARGAGVCRDFAHVAIALCRAMNLPARYVSGHLPDIGYLDPGVPMDFHAYMEVYLGGSWLTFDPRYNVPRIGRIKVAHGADAVDGAFATIFGDAQLTYFEVWAYQVDPKQVSVGDPIDLSKRLDGTREIRFAE
jgi:transglutaminase-like putative cysteine protease